MKSTSKSSFLFIMTFSFLLLLFLANYIRPSVLFSAEVSGDSNRNLFNTSNLLTKEGSINSTNGLLNDQFFSEIQSTTCLAMSPGLILFIKGGINFLKAKNRSTLPWHSRWEFLAGLGVLLLFFSLKDFIPFEPLQKFLMAAEGSYMKILGVLALLTGVPGFSSGLTLPIEEALNTIQPYLSMATAQAADQGFTETISGALPDFLATVAGTVIFLAVWLVSNTLNVLCLLAPALAAPILKGLRVTIVGSLAALGMIHPLLGFLASLVIIFSCLMLFRWSFRLTVWGSLFSFDLIFRRWRHEDPDSPPDSIQAFAGGRAAKLLKVPKRTLGRLRLQDGHLFFTYRRFLLFQRIVPVKLPFVIGRTLTAPILALKCPNDKYYEFFFFRLRDKGHEQYLKSILNASTVEVFGLLKNSQKTWVWIKGLFSRKNDELISA